MNVNKMDLHLRLADAAPTHPTSLVMFQTQKARKIMKIWPSLSGWWKRWSLWSIARWTNTRKDGAWRNFIRAWIANPSWWWRVGRFLPRRISWGGDWSTMGCSSWRVTRQDWKVRRHLLLDLTSCDVSFHSNTNASFFDLLQRSTLCFCQMSLSSSKRKTRSIYLQCW